MRNGGSLSAAGAKRASEPTKPNPAESWAERLRKSRRFWWSNMVRGLVGGWGLGVGGLLGHNHVAPGALVRQPSDRTPAPCGAMAAPKRDYLSRQAQSTVVGVEYPFRCHPVSKSGVRGFPAKFCVMIQETNTTWPSRLTCTVRSATPD